MRLVRPAPSAPYEPIVAMIDVVFFLLVFALLIGRLDATAPFDVAPPIAETGEDMPGGGMTIALSAEGGVSLDGRAVDPASLAGRVEQRLEAKPDLRIRINADASLRLRHVLPLVTDLRNRGARDVILVVTPGR